MAESFYANVTWLSYGDAGCNRALYTSANLFGYEGNCVGIENFPIQSFAVVNHKLSCPDGQTHQLITYQNDFCTGPVLLTADITEETVCHDVEISPSSLSVTCI